LIRSLFAASLKQLELLFKGLGLGFSTFSRGFRGTFELLFKGLGLGFSTFSRGFRGTFELLFKGLGLGFTTFELLFKGYDVLQGLLLLKIE